MFSTIEKSLLRKYFLQKRKNLKAKSYIQENLLINQQLKELILSQNHSAETLKIGLYLALNGEVDLTILLKQLPAFFAVPKIEKNQIYFTSYQIESPLEATRFKQLKQPQTNIKVEPDIFIIPALALDLAGNRLGYGGGFYDRYFNQAFSKQAKLKIGICFHEYLVAFLPKEVHDLDLDYVVTEKIIIKL